MILESSDIKNWDEFCEKLKNNLNPVIPDKLKGSIVRSDFNVVGFIDIKYRKIHKKDTKGNRLAKKKKRNKKEEPISKWSKMMINSLPDLDKPISLSMHRRGSYAPGGIFFRNEMEDLSPKPVDSSEEWIPRHPRLIFSPSKEFSQELIDFLNYPGKEIVVVGNNYYNKATGLKKGVTWLDEASDMADAFAYSLENRSFLEQQRKYIRENGVMEIFNDFDIIHNTIAVVSYSRRMYDEFIEGYPDYLRPAFVRIYEPNQHRGLTFTDYHVLDCPNFLSETAYDIKCYVRRPFTIKEIYNFRGFRFLIKPKTITPKPLY
ncbi:Uncharacterised protein [Algoriella xinjiangensis]|uniref:hypothetical protein n=1 Tax=Algoriella xinjiangensis TaxID=684065 RepID=UPI000F6310B6|nr:hypothetical protein [Algoriella xinjiangensis]VDH16868.1 Uncharacterised protein [Algoriella xinjiangensis]